MRDGGPRCDVQYDLADLHIHQDPIITIECTR